MSRRGSRLRLMLLSWLSLLGVSFLPLTSVAKVPTPVARADFEPYSRSANEFTSAIVIDVASGKRLYAYEPDRPWPAASLTKLMTALVFLDWTQRWDRVVALAKSDEVGGGRLRVRTGTRVSVRDLFYSSLVVRTSGGGVKKFVRRMQTKTTALGLKHTKFVDPTGISPRNVSTATELAALGLKSFSQPTLRRAVSTADYVFTLRNNGQKKIIHNTNHLLTTDHEVIVTGGKTGYLVEARHNLIVELSPLPGAVPAPKLMIVVLGAPNKAAMFASSKALALWAWKAYEW